MVPFVAGQRGNGERGLNESRFSQSARGLENARKRILSLGVHGSCHTSHFCFSSLSDVLVYAGPVCRRKMAERAFAAVHPNLPGRAR